MSCKDRGKVNLLKTPTKIDKQFKIAILGDGGVGKTSIRTKFIGKGFKATYMETVGADFSSKTILIERNLNKIPITFQIWDLAGQPKFEKIRQLFYEGSQGIIFVFDLTRLESLENIKRWVEEVLNNGIRDIPVLLIGNKNDLQEEGLVCCVPDDDRKLAEYIKRNLNNEKTPVHAIRTSAKTGYNVEESFQLLAREMYEKITD